MKNFKEQIIFGVISLAICSTSFVGADTLLVPTQERIEAKITFPQRLSDEYKEEMISMFGNYSEEGVLDEALGTMPAGTKVLVNFGPDGEVQSLAPIA